MTPISARAAVTALVAACAFALPPVSVRAAELPEATKRMLAELKMEASVLDGLDEELKVPDAWIEGAKTEGRINYLGTFGAKEWPKFFEPFHARYPFVEIDHQRASRLGRVDKPLIAFKEGRVIADMIAAIGGQLKGYKAADALMDLREIPNFAHASEDMRAPDGLWVGEKVKYWCMSYNTKLLKKEDLPRTWDDILTIKALHGRNIGVSDRPHNWILPLWTTKGADWARNYIDRFFKEVQPQLRKEGARAIVTLTIAGEFHAAIPSTDYRVYEYAEKGAPISWHCPEPVPVTISELVAIKGTKSPNAVKLFLNWYLSREGQLAQYYSSGGAPVHRGLQDIGFSQYPGEVRGKKVSVRTAESLEEEFTLALKAWHAAWKTSGGQVDEAPRKVSTTLAKVENGGRQLGFGVGEEAHTAKISASRTQITIAGKAAKRDALAPGMECDVTYAGDDSEATLVACK